MNPALNANAAQVSGIDKIEKIDLISGKSIVLNTTKSINRVAIGNPEVASNMVLSPKQLYITGKAAGTTNMIIWHGKKVVAIYDIVVSYDLSMLKEKLNEILPDEKSLNVTATNDSIMLSGRVTSAAILSQAVSIAESYAPKGNVRNLVEVGGVHQVMLEVRIAEMSKSLVRSMGVNMTAVNGDQFGVTKLGGLFDIVSPSQANVTSGAPFGVFANSVISAMMRFKTGGIDWTGFVDILQEEGLVKVLAEPTLVALSGQSAEFLAGGEFPVPVPQGLGSTGIEYKEYGIGLKFTPTVIGPGKIHMKVAPEVSELDFSTAIRFSGFVVPGISTRRTSTVVELGDGQSFVIAGLLRDTVRAQYSKYPILGDIPILGALFKSREFQKNETELVIIATPRLVKPIDAKKQPLPTDFYIEPDAKDFYIYGDLEGTPKDATDKKDGKFGHVVPKE